MITCGIQLGTSNAAIAWYDDYNRHAELIELEHADGEWLLPSVVFFAPDGNVLVGNTARNAAALYPDRVITGIQRLLGEDYRTPPIDGQQYSPQEVTAEILKVLKTDAELYIGEPIDAVVIAVPAYFGDRERHAIREAAELAGSTVLEIIPEPHAAFLAYAMDRTEIHNFDGNYVVYDLGGGSFNLTLISAEAVVTESITHLKMATITKDGDRFLGGVDWDRALATLVTDKVMDSYGVDDPHLDARTKAFLLDNCEKTKHALSHVAAYTVIADIQGNAVDVSRSEFEQAASTLLATTERLLALVLETAETDYGLYTEKRIQALAKIGGDRAGLTSNKVQVLLCGGASRMPMIQSSVERIIGEPPLQHSTPEFLVAMGTAYRAFLSIQPALDDFNINASPPPQIIIPPEITPSEPWPRPEPKTSPPAPEETWTVPEIVELFGQLNLPVTDDDQVIETAYQRQQKRWTHAKNSPGGIARVTAEQWFKAAAILRKQKNRAELIQIVYDSFVALADVTIETLITGQRHYVPESIANTLITIAQKQFNCDRALAEHFCDRYLQQHNLSVARLEKPTEQASATEVIALFGQLDLPVTDDDQVIGAAYQRQKARWEYTNRRADSINRAAADRWFKTAATLRKQKNRAKLIQIIYDNFVTLADAMLEAMIAAGQAIDSPSLADKFVTVAQTQLGCDDALSRQFTDTYLATKGYTLISSAPDENAITIFVSYSRTDWDDFVEPLIQHLEAEGFRIWVDQHLIEGGADWLDEINEALESCQAMILCVSPTALASRFVKMEYRYFLQENKLLIPIICQQTKIPAELRGIQYLLYHDQPGLTERLRRFTD